MLLAFALGLVLPGSASAELESLSRFGEFGSGPGQLSSPAQIAVAASGDLYVADSDNDRISVFAGDGTFLSTFGGGVLQDPRDVTLAADGRVFVASAGSDQVVVFSATGEFLSTIDDPQLTEPVAVALAGSTVFVAEGSDDSIVAFEEDGDLLGPFTTPGVPRDVIAGSDGNLYAIVESRVGVFTPAGLLIREFGDEGAGQLNAPAALAMDESGRIFVADKGEDAIERFGIVGNYLGGFPAGPDPVGVAAGCASNVLVVEKAVSFARVERFGEPASPPPPCAEVSVPIGAPVARPPSNRFRFAGLIKNRRNGSAVIFVRVPGPGRVIVHGRGVRRRARSVRQAKRVRLPVKPKIPLKRFLKQHGKARIRVKVTFIPTGGVPGTLEKVVVLRRKRS